MQINSDQMNEELVQIFFKGTKLTASLLQKAIQEWLKIEKKSTSVSDPEGRIDLAQLGHIDGKTLGLGTELNSDELKIVENEFKIAGVKRWSADKIGETYCISFPNTKANEVELAMKRYLEKSLNPQNPKVEKFSLRTLSTVFKDKMEKYNEGREAKDKHKSQERTL